MDTCNPFAAPGGDTALPAGAVSAAAEVARRAAGSSPFLDLAVEDVLPVEDRVVVRYLALAGRSRLPRRRRTHRAPVNRPSDRSVVCARGAVRLPGRAADAHHGGPARR